MPAAIAIPAIVGALSTGAAVYGAKKQSDAQKNALNAQVSANREAMNRAQSQEAAKSRMARSRWNDYSKRLELFYRNNPNAVKRYGYLPGFKEQWLQPGGGTPGTPGAPGQAPGMPGGGPVTLAGGRQVSGSDYDAYVQAREARRARMPAPGAPGGGASLGEITDPRRGVMT